MTKGGPRIGKCIYCGATVYSEHRKQLGREHVIPRKLGGELTVLEASCKKCEGIINTESENIVQNNDFYLLRHLLGLPSSSPLATIPVTLSDGRVVQIGTDIPQKILFMPRYAELDEMRRTNKFIDRPFVFWAIDPGNLSLQQDILRLHKASSFAHVKATLNPEPFRRLLAKIGHSFAVYILGSPDAFRPLLVDYILGKDILLPCSDYVTGPVTLGANEAARIHPYRKDRRNSLLVTIVEPNADNECLISVYIQLFASMKNPAPIYVVHVGYCSEDVRANFQASNALKSSTK